MQERIGLFLIKNEKIKNQNDNVKLQSVKLRTFLTLDCHFSF